MIAPRMNVMEKVEDLIEQCTECIDDSDDGDDCEEAVVARGLANRVVDSFENGDIEEFIRRLRKLSRYCERVGFIVYEDEEDF